MSDSAVLATVEGDILTALAGISGVESLGPTLSAYDLATRDGIRTPAIGVVNAAIRPGEGWAIGDRRILCPSDWHVVLRDLNLRGGVHARPDIYSLFGLINDRLHRRVSPFGDGRAYKFVALEYPDYQIQGRIVTVITYTLDIVLGN